MFDHRFVDATQKQNPSFDQWSMENKKKRTQQHPHVAYHYGVFSRWQEF